MVTMVFSGLGIMFHKMFLSYEPTIFEPLKRSINFAVIKPSMSGDIIKFRECSSVVSMSVFILLKYPL